MRALAPSALGLALVLVAAPAALADRLVLRDGRAVEGVVVKEGADYRVASRFGETVVPGKDVTEWVKAKSFDEEWRERLAAIPEGDLGARARLAKWLADAGRKAESEATAALVLEADPEHALAHEVLGHVRYRGAWMSEEESKRAQGLIRRGATWYTPAEWALLDDAGKRKADEAEATAVATKRGEAINEALRLMVAKDQSLRAEGERRLLKIAKDAELPQLAAMAPDVRAYAEASDRMERVLATQGIGGGGGHAVAETRIQLARLKRPIGSISTSLASGPTGVPFSTNSLVTIQLPELEVITLKSTVAIPTN